MPLVLLVLLPWFTPGLLSQPAESRPANRAPIATTGAFFAISVADIQASAEWYARTFGLTITMPLSKGESASAMVLEGGGLIVELVQHTQAARRATDPVLQHGLFKAGFVVDDLDGTLAALKARHVAIAYGPFPARPNQRANVVIRDAEGNLIQIFGK